MAFIPSVAAGAGNKFSGLLGVIDIGNESIANFFREQKEEEAYLKSLADEYAPKESRNYSLARSIVLDIHSHLDYIISYGIGILCIYGRRDEFFPVGMLDRVIEELMEIPYGKRLKIAEELKIFSSKSIKIFWEVNNVRVAFAHRHKKNKPNYNYNGESIFKKQTISKLRIDNKNRGRFYFSFKTSTTCQVINYDRKGPFCMERG